MVFDPSARTVSRLGKLLAGDGPDPLPDAELLRRYAAVRDEAAFAGLVRRHGPLVFGVCRRVLSHQQDAEDAFQATFLVLARKAGGVRGDTLSRWLYGVARRVANKALSRREKQTPEPAHLDFLAADPDRPPLDWLPLLDAALRRLPDRHRWPIVLCDLQGRTRAEAAAELGIGEGTLSSRLARAREKLRTKLGRLGVSLSAAGLAADLTDSAAGTVPPTLIETTLAAGSSAAAARDLAEGVMRGMALLTLTKYSTVTLGLLAAGVVLVPWAGAEQQPAAKETPKTEAKPASPSKAKAEEKPASKDSPAYRVRLLQEERAQALRTQFEGQFERVKIGKDPLLVLLDCRRELWEVETALAADHADKLKAAEGCIRDLTVIEEQLVQLRDAGLQTKEGVSQGRAARLKAEIELEKLKAQKP